VALIFNDGAYGNARRTQRELYGNRVIASDLSNPDFVRFGDSFGLFARSARIRTACPTLSSRRLLATSPP
jgi:acetolactate synthase-1/2/3 large subunit